MAAATPPPPGGDPASSLRRRRDEFAEQVAEQQWDLGGLAYEMAIRDHFRLDVLVRRAAELQERDAELAEVERLLRMEEAAAVGACPRCAAPHSRGALFCWQCGTTLMERAGSAAARASSEGASAQTTVESELDTLIMRPAGASEE
jgi:ribosomal protein L37AE/L43A